MTTSDVATRKRRKSPNAYVHNELQVSETKKRKKDYCFYHSFDKPRCRSHIPQGYFGIYTSGVGCVGIYGTIHIHIAMDVSTP